MKHIRTGGILLLLTGLLTCSEHLTAQSLQVGINRWLEVRQVQGSVIYQRGTVAQKAQVGTKLQAVGDTVMTGENSKAVLAVDSGIGFVNVLENTTIRIQNLRTTPTGGRITQIQVSQGQARLQVRPFTNSGSRLEIQTPAGVSGVRGTVFGVSVQPNGKTGVATLEGGVVTSAQGKSVAVNAQFQNLTIPGEPPTPAVPLRDSADLNVQTFAPLDRQTVQIVGQVDPVNVLMVANQPIDTDRSGRFDVRVTLPPNRQIEAVVITPLGKRQRYALTLP